MAIIASFSDNNSVKMTQKACILMVAEPGFGPVHCSKAAETASHWT